MLVGGGGMAAPHAKGLPHKLPGPPVACTVAVRVAVPAAAAVRALEDCPAVRVAAGAPEAVSVPMVNGGGGTNTSTATVPRQRPVSTGCGSRAQTARRSGATWGPCPA
jgi:hypothetical protein